jgi:L-asparaginase
MNIAILYTGGTIGCIGSPLVPLSEERFEVAFTANIIPIIQSQYPGCCIHFLSFGTALDSTNMQPSDWCKMASVILSNYSCYDAFVVLHGTDTMAWTASALSFLFTGLQSNGYPNALLSKPIIVTGAQLPLFSENSQSALSILFNTDAFQNVCGAIAAAQTGISEVCLYFNDSLLRGNRTVKINASEFSAFSSPNYPNLGKLGVEFRLQTENILRRPTSISLDSESAQELLANQLEYISCHIDESVVIPFLAFPAYYETQSPNTNILNKMLSASLELGIDGIILQSYGEGNFPSGNPAYPEKGVIYQTLKTAHNRGIVLIDCTQVLTGIVNSKAYLSGSWLGSVGAVSAYDMTPIAALTKLIYLNTLRCYNNNNWNQSTIEQLMLTNLSGEIMEGV